MSNIYSQNNPAWRNEKIGFDTGQNDTLGNYGCYMTAIANVCTWAGNNLNPSQVNQLCKDRGWLVRNDLIARDDIPALLCSNLQFAGRTKWTGPTPMGFFADASSPDVAYIIEIDASKAPGIQTHFVMVWSLLGADDLEIDDSWDGIRRPLSHYGSPSLVIQSATKFVKVPVATPPPEPPPAQEPVVEMPAPPYVPPAPPNKGTQAEKYLLKATVMWFGSANDAAFHMDAKGTLDAGEYYIWGKEGKSYNLSKDNMKDHRQWVNLEDNVVQAVVKNAPKMVDVNPPKPVLLPSQVKVDNADTTWKATYKPFYPDGHADRYKTLQQIVIQEYGGKRGSDVIPEGHELAITGTFVKDGVTFYRPRSGRDEFFSWYYGIPLFDDNGVPNIVKVTGTLDKIEMSLRDLPRIWIEDIKQIFASKKGSR